jgi:hypothetical protein
MQSKRERCESDRRLSDPPFARGPVENTGMKTLLCAEMAGTRRAMLVDKLGKACV